MVMNLYIYVYPNLHLQLPVSTSYSIHKPFKPVILISHQLIAPHTPSKNVYHYHDNDNSNLLQAPRLSPQVHLQLLSVIIIHHRIPDLQPSSTCRSLPHPAPPNPLPQAILPPPNPLPLHPLGPPHSPSPLPPLRPRRRPLTLHNYHNDNNNIHPLPPPTRRRVHNSLVHPQPPPLHNRQPTSPGRHR